VKNIKHLLDVVDKVRDHVALGLMSDPGLSKTAQVKQWAEEHGRTYCELIISQRMPSEISGMPMPVSDKGTMEIFDFQTLLNLKDGDVLAFDEFTNGNIQTLNACLTLIQERTMLSGKKLPSLIIVAMGNPQGRCDLLPQTKQRFWWVDVVWDGPTWKRYMKTRWNLYVSNELVKVITDQYQRGFAAANEYNYFTPRTMENLIRVAQTIDVDDPFWDTGAVPAQVVRGIYESLTNVTTFARISEQLQDWVNAQPIKTVDADGKPTTDTVMLEFFADLMACGSIEDLKEFIKAAETHPEYESIMPQFLEFLNTNDLRDPKMAVDDDPRTNSDE
jgi:hypothetical protein